MTPLNCVVIKWLASLSPKCPFLRPDASNPLVHRLLNMFIQNPHIHTIAFMKPARGRADMQERLDELLEKNMWTEALKNHMVANSGSIQ